MDKKNMLVIGAILLAAVILLALTRLTGGSTVLPDTGESPREDTIVILLDGQAYQSIPLSQPQTVTVEQDGGRVNVIEVTEKGAVMQSSSCPGQECVEMGAVTVDNWEFRPYAEWIHCLHNRVSVQLVVTE